MKPIDNTNELLRRWLAGVETGSRKIYLVGGTVRDLLMGRPPKDLDLVCRGAKDLAYEIADKRNAALVPLEKKPDEPCYRLVDRDDVSSFIDLAELRGMTIEDDLRQRDFTINAIAAEAGSSIDEIGLIDPLGGMEDIKGCVIRMTGSDVFRSDPLRILRAIRLQTFLGFSIEQGTEELMRDSAALLGSVSAERIMSEVFMILGQPDCSSSFRKMDSAGILNVVFPEILPMKGCSQNGYHHLDVWEHSLLVMENVGKILSEPTGYFGEHAGLVMGSLPPNGPELLKLTALLHDIGKPAVREIKQDTGRITFHGHDSEGAGIVKAMSGRLKLSGAHAEFIIRMVENHLRPIMLLSPKASDAARMRWFRKIGDGAVPALIIAMADVMSSQGPDSGEEYRREFVQRAGGAIIDYLQRIRNRILSAPLITGADLIAAGMEPGPVLGMVLRRVRAAQDTGTINSFDDAMNMVKKLASEMDFSLKN